METIRLSEIVLSKRPEVYECLTPEELEAHIVLKNGMERLSEEDLLQIIEFSISETKKGKDGLYH